MSVVAFTKEENQLLKEWDKSHDCDFREAKDIGAIGGRLTYQLTPTGLGMVTKVICACGKEADLTDYDSW